MLSDTEIKVVTYLAERAIACLEEIRDTARGKDSNIESKAARVIAEIRAIERDAKLR